MMQEEGGEYTPDDFVRLQMIGKLCVGSVLDVGAGPGYLVRYLPFDNKYLGVDIDTVNDIHYSSAYSLEFEDGYFDTVVLAEVLEHLTRPVHALLEAYRVAAKRIVISVPNPWDMDQMASLLRHGYNIQNPNHVALYGDNEIQSLCKYFMHKKIAVHRFYTRIPGIEWTCPIRTIFGRWNIYVVDL